MDEPQIQSQPFKPIEALPYETPQALAPGKRIGLVMVIGFALLGISIFPTGMMIAVMEHYPPHENVAIFMGIIGGIIILSGLALIITAAREMLRR